MTARLASLETAADAYLYYSSHGQTVNVPKEYYLRELDKLNAGINSAKNLPEDFVKEASEKIKNITYKLSPVLKAADLYEQKTPSGQLNTYMVVGAKQILLDHGIKDKDHYVTDKFEEKFFVVVSDKDETEDYFFKELSDLAAPGRIRYFQDGGEALKFIKNQTNKKDIIVLTDMIMSPVDGLTLLKAIKETDKDITVLAASAAVKDENALSFVQNGFDGAVQEADVQFYETMKFFALGGSLKNFKADLPPEMITEALNFFETADFQKADIETILKYYNLLNFASSVVRNKREGGYKVLDDSIQESLKKPQKNIAFYYYNKLLKAYREIMSLPEAVNGAGREELISRAQTILHGGVFYFGYLNQEQAEKYKYIKNKVSELDKETEFNIRYDGLVHSVDVRDAYLELYPSERRNMTNEEYIRGIYNPLQDYLHVIAKKVSPAFYDEADKKMADLLDRLSPESRAERLLAVKTLPEKLNFYFDFMVPNAAKNKKEYAELAKKLHTKTFIIVNDDEKNAEKLKARFNWEVGRVLNFKTAEEAVSAIKSIPDKKDIIVFADLLGADGFGILNTVKRIDPEILVAAASAEVNDDNRMTLVKAGFDGAVGINEESKITRISQYMVLYGSMKNIDIHDDPQIIKDTVKFFLTPGWDKKPIEEIERNYLILSRSDDWSDINYEKREEIEAVQPTRPLVLHYYKILREEYDKDLARGREFFDPGTEAEFLQMLHKLNIYMEFLALSSNPDMALHEQCLALINKITKRMSREN